MNRRRLLQIVGAAIPFLPNIWSWVLGPSRMAATARSMSRVRPTDPEWPSEASWNRLSQKVGGRLVKVESPLTACVEAPIAFRPGNVLVISMVFQGLNQQQAEMIWRPFFEWLAGSPQDFMIVSEPRIAAVPAQHFWDPQSLKRVPGVVLADDRPSAPEANVFYASNLEEAGQVLHGYQSAWIPASLLQKDRQRNLSDALFAAAQHWGVSLHFNKGLAGAPAEAIAAGRDTAMNPAVLDAFALIISGAQGPPAYPGIPGHEPDLSVARQHVEAIDKAMNEIRKLLSNVGSYVSEGNFFDEAWQESFWGGNYARLVAAKDKYDPDALFFVHHGVGSERWSSDGFTQLT